jgi:hypothetical protein
VTAKDASILAMLDEGALEQVLLAAKYAGTLGLLASSSRQLCSFARSRVPVRLVVFSKERAHMFIKSHARGRPPFSGCTQLSLSAGNAVKCCMALGVLQAAQQWTGLQELNVCAIGSDWLDGDTEEYCTSSLLSGVPALQQLRVLTLESSALGASCAAQLVQLTQLTRLKVAATRTPVDAAADLTALGHLTNLVELRLDWALAPHLPAGPKGPYCLPSSLVTLHVSSTDHTGPATMACWLAHLPGCPQLQQLELVYGQQQHASVHPSALVPLLAKHQPQLRSLCLSDGAHAVEAHATITWDAAVAGLPAAAAAPVPAHWQPDASLAALTGLQSLSGDGLLCIREQVHWQHLAQLTALTGLAGGLISSVPQLQAGSTLALLELEEGEVALGGYDVGRLLLACPLLKVGIIIVTAAAHIAAGARLLPHPTLQKLHLKGCDEWGEPAVAGAHFAALAPVLGSVSNLDIMDWPHGSSSEAQVMPDLSPCTAVTSLAFGAKLGRDVGEVPLEQEAILCMVAPLKQLQRLEVLEAPRVNARVALVLQSMLPHLQQITLSDCGRLLPVAESSGDDSSDSEDDEESDQEFRARQQVLQLLRADLKVLVSHRYGIVTDVYAA